MEELLKGLLAPLFGFLGRILLSIVIRLLAVPFCGLISTPVVLVRAFYGPGTYLDNVKSDYVRITLAVLGWDPFLQV